MIHLDTNYLVGLVTGGSPLRPGLDKWFRAGEVFATSAIAWSEFVTGPVTDQQIREASHILENRVITFGIKEANLAAQIFNEAGRKRSLRIDSFIAATAISSSALLATNNQKDFLLFTASGLRLA